MTDFSAKNAQNMATSMATALLTTVFTAQKRKKDGNE